MPRNQAMKLFFTAFPQVPLLSQRQPQFHQPAATERQQEVSLVMVRNGVLHLPRNARRKGIKIVLWSRAVTAASYVLDSSRSRAWKLSNKKNQVSYLLVQKWLN